MLRIVGDLCFADWYFDVGFGIGTMLQKGQNPLLYCPFKSNDIWIGNLECTISETTENKGIESKYFRICEKDFLKSYHCDIYVVANNHIMQHGNSAYINTLSAISKVGQFVGSNDRKSISFEHDGFQYAVVAFSLRGNEFSTTPLYWHRPELTEIKKEFDKISDKDCKIVYIHWGNEFINYPNVAQKKFGRWLIDIGFDMVVGCHPHVLQGYEIYNNKYIFYSLGNFLFNMPAKESRYSVIVNVSFIENKLRVSYDYVTIKKNNMPQIIEKEKVPLNCTFEYLNRQIQIDDDNELYYTNVFRKLSENRKLNHKWILKSIYKYNRIDLIEIIKSYLKRRIK